MLSDVLSRQMQLIFILLIAATANAQNVGGSYYNIGSPTLSEIFVDPVAGNDSNSGNSRGEAIRTVAEAWGRIPQGSTLTGTGYRINLLPGTYPRNELPNYWENRHGTAQFPIIIQAIDGRGTATFRGDLNLYDIDYMYLIDFNIIPLPAGDAWHCELCNHHLVRGMVISGAGEGTRGGHDLMKANQSQYIFIEESNIGGAYENAIDFVAVQYGHIKGNKIHDADDWCMYTKGGSAQFTIEQNEIHDCGTGGYTAGQGTGFEYMVSPWFHYEAYDIKFVNNIIHDTEGAAFGVNGGYNILLAHNTAYRVGSRSHTIEVVFGSRSCDGDSAACAAHRGAGGWGPSSVSGDTEYPVGNRNVFIYNNIIYNPPGFASEYQHFAIYGPRAAPGGSGLASPQRTDTNLRIAGNIIWNGGPSMPLGFGSDEEGCADANPTCNAALVLANNQINTIQPQLLDPDAEDFRPSSGGNIEGLSSTTIPNFAGGDRPTPPLAPQGNLGNTVGSDRGDESRSGSNPPGAYVSSSSSIGPQPPTDGVPGGGGGGGGAVAPEITIRRVSAQRRGGNRVRLLVRATISDNQSVASAQVVVTEPDTTERRNISLRQRGSSNRWFRRFRVPAVTSGVSELNVEIRARDNEDNESSALTTVNF